MRDAAAEGTDPADWDARYNALFYGPGPALAPPYESFYRCGGRVMGDRTIEARNHYESEGFVSEPAGELPDHVAVELGFIAHLAREESAADRRGESEEARRLADARQSFLREHLASWISSLRAHLDEPGDPVGGPVGVVTGVPVVVGLGVDGPMRAPAVALSVPWIPAGGCSLCVACSTACTSGALSLLRDARGARLVLDVDHCDGCRRCQLSCPDKAIVMIPGNIAGRSRVLAAGEVVRCILCGEGHTTERALQTVLSKLGASPESSLSRQLRRCPRCRARSTAASAN